MIRLTLVYICVVIACASCSDQTYLVVNGPAQLTIAGTPYTPGISVGIQEGGRIWKGPNVSDFYYIANGAAEQPADEPPGAPDPSTPDEGAEPPDAPAPTEPDDAD